MVSYNMIRLITLVIFFVITTLCSSAQSLTGKKWINLAEHNYLEFNPDSSFNHQDGSWAKADVQRYQINSDSLKFLKSYIRHGEHGLKFDTSIYKIIYFTIDTLTLKHCRGNELGYDVDTFIFVSPAKLYDSTFNFDRLYFSGTGCLGTCPDLKLEIYSTGLIYFLGKTYTGRYRGMYKGKMSVMQMNQLVEILRKGGISTFPRGTDIGIDAPIYHMIIEHQNGKNDFEGSSFPPYNEDLALFLLNEYKKFELKRCRNCHKFKEKDYYEKLSERYPEAYQFK